jgi:hypothetical protein
MLNIKASLSDKEALLWGGAAVHPSVEGYKQIAAKLEADLASEAKFTQYAEGDGGRSQTAASGPQPD